MNFRGIAGSLSFAHLAGLASAKKAKKDGDKEADTRCEDDEEDEAKAETVEKDGPGEDEHDNRGAKKGKNAKGKKADAEDGDPDDDDEDEDEEDDEHKDGEDDDGRMKKGRKEGRKAERARIGAILNHPAAAKNLQLAARLACNTGMSVGAVVALLESQPAASRLATKMETNRPPAVGPGADGEGPKGDAAIQASWDHAMKPFQPKPR